MRIFGIEITSGAKIDRLHQELEAANAFAKEVVRLAEKRGAVVLGGPMQRIDSAVFEGWSVIVPRGAEMVSITNSTFLSPSAEGKTLFEDPYRRVSEPS